MAIIKSLPATKSLKKQLEYLEQEGKTLDELKVGINCTKDNVLMEFNIIKELYNKPIGKEYYHFTQSFSPQDNITAEKANKLGIEWINSVIDGHQIYMVTHIDRDHIHNHFVINSVNMNNGKKIQISPAKLFEMKRSSNKICKREGYYTINLDRNVGISKTHNEYNLERRYRLEGESVNMWKGELRETIEHVITSSRNIEEFKERLKKEHNISIREKEKDFIYVHENINREVAGKRLGGYYRKESIVNKYIK